MLDVAFPDMRYEVAVETPIAFHTQQPPYRPMFPEAEDVVIEFEGRRFVWHATHTDPDGEACWPTVTTLVQDGNAYEPERRAMERFLSALSYYTRLPIRVVNTTGSGVAGEMDKPVAATARRGPGNHLHEAPLELVAVDDDRLRIVMGYYRDGEATASPFFRFLAFYNALEVACEDHHGRMAAWLRANAGARPYHWNGAPPVDLWAYVQDESRHAVAHAVRDGRGPEIDPNDPAVRARFHRDSGLLADFVTDRVRERWGPHAVRARRQPLNG